MPIVAPFVDKHDSVREEFTDFAVCNEGTTGRAIADKILAKLNEYQLDISSL